LRRCPNEIEAINKIKLLLKVMFLGNVGKRKEQPQEKF